MEFDRTVQGTAETLTTIFRNPGGFSVPLFQRSYSWGDKQVLRLLTDLWQAHGTSGSRKVFLGSMVTQREGDNGPYNLIDGQQRWTTINLVLLALKELFLLGDDTAAAAAFDPRLKAQVVRQHVEPVLQQFFCVYADMLFCRILMMSDVRFSDQC